MQDTQPAFGCHPAIAGGQVTRDIGMVVVDATEEPSGVNSTITDSTRERVRQSNLGWFLAVLAITQLIIQVDTTIVTVALPSVQDGLNITDANRHWVVTAYAIAFGGLLLLGGRLSDYFGRKRAIVWSLVGFGVASLLGGVAVNAELLFSARALQGAFAAVMAPAVLSLISTTFTEPKARARAFAIWGGVGGLGGSLGLILGGVLTEYASWRWTLLVNTPIAIAIAVGVSFVVQDHRGSRGPLHFDIPGTLTSMVGIAAVVFGATQAEAHGWLSPQTLVPLATGAVLVASFFVIEHRTSNPLLPLSVLKDRVRGSSFAAMAVLTGAIFASNVLIIYYLQQVRGFSALESGFAFLPQTVAVVVCATLGGRLMPIVGARKVVVVGLVSGIVGFILLGTYDADTNFGLFTLAMVLVGIATGLSWPVLSATALFGVAAKDAGAAGGTVNVAQQAGGAIVVAVLNTVAATVTASSGSIMDGLSVALFSCAGLMAVAVLASLPLGAHQKT